MRVYPACRAAAPVEPLILIEEISHRVYNEYAQVIAGIHVAARSASSTAARQALEAAATRLVQFADAHRALQAPRKNEDLDLAGHLRTLVAATTAATLRDGDITITLDAEPILLPAGRCWRVALIVAELITNSVRHGLNGESGEICVTIEAQDDLITCRVSDDGAPRPSREPGQGTRVVTGLAAQLGGVVSWKFGDTGTTAELVFPIMQGKQTYDTL